MRLLPALAFLSLASSLVASPLSSDAPSAFPTLPIWPEGKMPGKAVASPEVEVPIGDDNVLRIRNVSHPILTIVKPSPPLAGPTPAFVICPGGGYGILAYDKEGTEIAAWLASLGVTGIILKYRVPGNPDGALQDIERAVRLVRVHATEWNVDPKKVGVIGFSAGGHLCARLSTNFATDAYPALDDTDKESCRPDAVVLVYPAYLEKTQDKEHLGILAPGLPMSALIPPTLIVHNEDDPNFIAGSKLYHAALDEAGTPNEFALYPTGGHGYGLRCTKDAKDWPNRCKAWLEKIGFLPSSS